MNATAARGAPRSPCRVPLAQPLSLLTQRHVRKVCTHRGRPRRSPHGRKKAGSVNVERVALNLDAILGDDADLDSVAGANVTLAGRVEGVLDEVDRLLEREVGGERRRLGPKLLVLPL